LGEQSLGILYFLVTLFATVIGAIAGIGGGIIIKPTLDAIGTYNLATISVLSSITVLCMAAVSTAKYMKSGIKFDFQLVILSFGAVLGGFMGKYFFDIFSRVLSDKPAKAIQAALLILLLVFSLFRKYYPQFNIKNKLIILLAGLVMGLISSFLGIGGGPINIVIICIAFSVDTKDAAVYSIFVILFSQFSNVINTSITPGLNTFDLGMLAFMLPAAVIGGFVGSYLNRRLSKKSVEHLFNGLMSSVILLNIYNIYIFFLK
jgi:uncharacterized membrane protein YfcA